MRLRWLIGALMFVGGMINYLDRSALAVAAPFIARDLHLDPARLGIVFSAFSTLAAVRAQLPQVRYARGCGVMSADRGGA